MQVKNRDILLFILAAMLLIMPTTQAQSWRSLNGPVESDVRDIVIKNDTLYVASRDPGGIFKKALGSTQWYHSGIETDIVGYLSFNVGDNGNYYAGGEGIISLLNNEAYLQFFQSSDYGHSWVNFRDGIEYSHSISDIFMTSGDNVLIGGNGGIFMLEKDENNFERTGGNGWVHVFYEHDDTLFAGTGKGIEYSVDEGVTWTETGTDTLDVYGITFAGDDFYLGTDDGLYKTKALDHPWSLVEDLYSTPINTILTFQNKIVAGSDSGAVIISIDNTDVSSVLPELVGQCVNVIESLDETLYLGTNNGLYSYDMNNKSAKLIGVPNSNIRALTISKSEQNLLYAGTIGSAYRYNIESGGWDTVSVPVKTTNNIIPYSEESFFTVNGRYFFDCSFQTSKCDSLQVDPGNPIFNITQSNNGDLFLVSRSGVFQSGDNGSSWNSIFNFKTNNGNFRSPVFTVSDSLLFFHAPEQGLVKYSLKNGNYTVTGFEKTGINAYHLTSNGVIYVSAFNSIHKSTDMGVTWDTLLYSQDVKGNDILIEVLYDEISDKLYAIGFSGRVYVSRNEGVHWGINEEMYPTTVQYASIGTDGKLFLGTAKAGVFENTKPLDPPISISIKEESRPQVPQKLELSAYPNPFNPTTQIQYTLPEAGSITISVFNVLGQKVRTLAEGTRSSGAHRTTFNATGLPAGMYVVLLESTSQSGTVFTETKKVMLLK
jgi:hypothetical protein